MFTGIVEELGSLEQMHRAADSYRLAFHANKVLEGVNLGDSIAVNGICLTVTSFGERYFTADAVPETVQRTTLASLRPGSKVNLERAMAAGGRFGGHFVSGHIDGTAVLSHKAKEGNAFVLHFRPNDSHYLKYILPKGSIAIDGISLTVMDVTADSFNVSIIPHTWGETTLSYKQVGEPVNIECDMIGKYVERFLSYRFGGEEPPRRMPKGTLTEQFLADNGFV